VSVFNDAVKSVFNQNSLPLSEEQAALFGGFYTAVAEKNKVMNLTRITEPGESAVRHFYDSACVLKYVDFSAGAKIIDIGTGAGFPGVPLAILRPDISVTLLDSSEKKTDFLRQAAGELGLKIEVLTGRAEELGHSSQREKYDIAVSRAVASLPALLELCLPFVKTGGLFVAYKGADYAEEIKASTNAVKAMHAEAKDVFLPYESRANALIVFRKLKETDARFPRKYAQIKNKPL
jgi:16S rRNA (guanine527-N7)-methyltransferase